MRRNWEALAGVTDLDPIAGYSRLMLLEIVRLFCGDLLGRGQDRDVYEHTQDPKRVVKVERSAGAFQNVIEWETWNQVKHMALADYLAPCHAISSCGVVLIQTRVQPLPPKGDPLLKHLVMPEYLGDFKRSNYGVLNGNVVACDYGSNVALNHGAVKAKMRLVKWRTDSP